MPKFQISDSQTGRTLTIEGDAPPTEQDAAELFASLPPKRQGITPEEMALKPSPKPNTGLPFAEVQPGGRVIQRMPGNDPERNRAELSKAFQSMIPQTSDEDQMRANLKQMSMAEAVSPTPKAEVAETLSKPYEPPNKTLAGVVKGVEGLAEGFTSPVGIATLGMGALPSAAQKVVSLAFAAQMVKQTPEIATQLGTEFGKPPEEQDQQKIAQLITEAAGTVGFTTLAAKHGLTPEPAPNPMQGPLPTGAVLQMSKGAKPLATIGDMLEAKGTPLPEAPVKAPSVPVAASEAPKPPQTPPVVESAPKSHVGDALKQMGYDVKEWDMPGVGKQLQVTSPESGAAKGMTVYVPENATLEQVTQRLEQKRTEFEAAAQPTKSREQQLARLKELRDLAEPLARKGGLTSIEAARFRELNAEANSIRFDLQKPLDVSKIGTPRERRSTLSNETVATARNDLMRNKDVYAPIVESASGVSHDADTPVDDVVNGKNPKVSEQQLYEAFNDTREALRKQFGNTVTLFRAEGKQRAKATQNWATTRDYAKQFGNNIVSKQVPIDDIVAVNVGPSGKYHEVIVKNKGVAQSPTAQPPSQSPETPNLVSSETPSPVKTEVVAQKPIPKEEQTQVGKEPKQTEFVGMGGAVPSEFGPGDNAGRESYGIAERVRSARAEAGEVAEVPPGQGIGAQESVEHGRDLLTKGSNAEKALSDFEKTKRLSSDDMAVVRAQGENLAQAARNIERKFGTDSREFKMAWDALSAWDTRSKAMQTEWHKSGMAQQGETDIDTGTFTGLARAFKADTGKDFTPKQQKQAVVIADKVTKATAEADKATDDLYKKLDTETGTVNESVPTGKPSVKKTAPVAIKDARKVFADYKKGEPMTPEQVKTLWQFAKDHYLNKGETDFDNIRQGLATDFGIDKADVTKGLGQPKGVKRLSDEMYAKLSEQRRLQNAAKTWIKNQALPGWYRFVKGIPRAFFVAKVFGHGTVGMITHAGLNIFNPAAWKTYWPNFLRQFKLIGLHEAKVFGGPGGGAYHEQAMRNLINDPLFTKAKRAGLANDPYRYTDDYNNAFSGWFHKLGLSGNRGFDALKLFRQARFNQAWNDLPASLQTPEMATLIADSVNHSTGVVKMRFREWANWTFFAPKLEGSRWAWMIGDPFKAAKTLADWKGATPEARNFAMSQVKEKATITGVYLSLLAINQGLLAASGSKQKVNFTNPRRGDFLAFKADGYQFGVISPMIAMVRLFANLYHASAGKRGRVEALTPRAAEFGQVGEEYARGKLSPFMGFGVDLTSQADFQGRPLPYSKDRVPAYLRREGVKKYTYGEYASEQFTPIPVSEAVREVWRHQGMTEAQINTYLKALSTAVVMGTTGARMQEDTHQEK